MADTMTTMQQSTSESESGKSDAEQAREIIERFKANGRTYFKIHRVSRKMNKSSNEVANALRALEQQGVIGRWNPESNGTIVWTIEDITAGTEDRTDD